MRYRDRMEAGSILGDAVRDVLDTQAVVVGVPRGGVVVGRPVADVLGSPLDVAVARKLGAPRQPELAIGAVTADGPAFLNMELVRRLGLRPETLSQIVTNARSEARRREALYRGGRDALVVADRTVVVVDDGVATGATVVAILRMFREGGVGRLVLAVPVGAPSSLAALRDEADVVICPFAPSRFMAVGEWYRDFAQVTDEEVLAALAADGP